MEYKNISKRAILLWETRLILFALLLSTLISSLFDLFSTAWLVLTALWVAAFFVMFLWYYPLKFLKLRYRFESELLIVQCGVIYTRRKYIQLNNIQYIQTFSTPLARLLKLTSLYVVAAGGMIPIPAIEEAAAEKLRAQLTNHTLKPEDF